MGCHPSYGNSINFIIVHPALSNWRLAGTWSASDRTYCGVNMSKNDSTVSVAFVVPHKGGRLSRSWASSSLLRCRHLRGVGHLMVPFHNYLPLDVFFSLTSEFYAKENKKKGIPDTFGNPTFPTKIVGSF